MNKDNKVYLQDSGWKFVTSEGLDWGVSVTKFSGVAGSGGNIFVAPQSADNDVSYELRYRSVGVSASIGTATSLDVATTSMDCAGKIYANPLRISEGTLTLNDLTGAYLAYSISAAAGDGRSWTVMFIGVGLALVSAYLAIPLTAGASISLAPAAAIASCRASVWYWGDLVGAASVGVSGSLGYISYSKELTDTLKNYNKQTVKLLKQN
jgi:hypothetical protein